MSETESSIFEFELTLDNELKDLFNDYKEIWDNYPLSNNPEAQTVKRDIHNVNRIGRNSRKGYLKYGKYGIAATVVLFAAIWLIPFRNETSAYVNHRHAGKGQRLTIYLPDSSRVILNSESEIKYADHFVKTREVWLTGEAFFDVVHNASIPFVVHTCDLEVTVLGTSFDVNAYTPVQTVSLERGKVNVLFKKSRDRISLLPGEQLVWNSKSHEVIKRNFDKNRVTAWKDNTLIFDDINFGEAINNINKFYGVNFIIGDKFIMDQHITGAFKDQNLKEFIASIKFIANVEINETSPNNYVILRKK